jgi:AbiV family abortive infection protein
VTLSATQIDSYIAALTENAKDLIAEAQLLLDAGRFARSMTLSHIAREELSKCVILHSAGYRAISGIPVDWKVTMRRLRDHKSKLKLETVLNATAMAGMGQQETSNLMLSNAATFAEYRNDRKNDSLYVTVHEGAIRKPSDLVSKEQAARNLSLASMALAQESRYQAVVGPLDGRQPMTRKPPDISSMTSEEIVAMTQVLGKVWIALSEASNLEPGESKQQSESEDQL